MRKRPLLSVVVASTSSLDLLRECLTALRPQCERASAELIVARAGPEHIGELARIAAGCAFVAAPAAATLPRVRGVGLSKASGEWVALTEDHCVADAGWIHELMAAAHSSVHVLGGSMGNARRERSIDCGAFFAEYGIYGGRQPTRPQLFAAANVAYHRHVIAEVVEGCAAGDWEDVIHDRLRATGREFLLVRSARVRQNTLHAVGAFCMRRFQHGRGYARTRSRTLSRWRRAGQLAATPVLPPLLAARILRVVDPEDERDFLRALPATLMFLAAWSLGEAVGYAMP